MPFDAAIDAFTIRMSRPQATSKRCIAPRVEWLPGLVRNPNFRETNPTARAENVVSQFAGFHPLTVIGMPEGENLAWISLISLMRCLRAPAAAMKGELHLRISGASPLD